MPYTPKFKIGEIVERISSGQSDIFVVVGTYQNLCKYSERYNHPRIAYNDSEPGTTLYLLINVTRETTCDWSLCSTPALINWYFETELENEVYCRNEERGNLYIKKYLWKIIEELDSTDEQFLSFQSEMLGGIIGPVIIKD